MLKVHQLAVHAGSFALENISFEVPTGACFSLMGPSGSGKTTLMEALCGLRHVDSGTIHLSDRTITDMRPGDRNIALVPQDNALFPHLTIRQHLSFGPQIRRWSKTDTRNRCNELAEQLGLTQLLDRYPAKLSGGEAKRVALGRALASRPDLLCLDEALTGLDDGTHNEVLSALQQTISDHSVTTLHITHNRKEAQALACSIIEMDQLRSQPSQIIT
ncbi:ABC transporter ATP-binding protein [Verrucomicrobiaceae bacterium N1E253]|uniref:ABC transporter ATP-binding protein n=1 Tax=Oceaniferula marina TaxID=2748318 RepID=A0A851GB29_9BACT|nr:ABC transporter ATP-binding protein [Oceaniferula marina]NWK54369.1 ABC transporter ATP-binding protein [Oceaniferula marina]